MGFTLQPAVRDNFIDREDILKEMLDTLSAENIRMGYALVGVRRIGKTSILKEVVCRLNQRNDIIAVYFSLWDLVENTAFEFCRQLSLAIIESAKTKLSIKYKIQHLIKVPAVKFFDFLKTIDFKISLFEDLEFSLGAGKKGQADINTTIEKVFRFVEALSRDLDSRFVIMLDEFPSIMELKNGTKLGEGIIKKIRTIHEDLTNTILCVSGSIRRTMDIAVLSQSAAFYRQFIVRQIGPFEISVVKKLMCKNLSQNINEDAIRELYNYTKGIPFYIQFIGRSLDHPSNNTIDKKTVKSAFDNFLAEEGDILFSEELKALSDKEKSIITAMAVHGLNVPKDICKVTKESSNIVSRYMEYFLDKGILNKQAKGYYEFTDPVFLEWLKRRYAPTFL